MCKGLFGAGGVPKPSGADRIAATGEVPTVEGLTRAQVLNRRTDVLANFSKQRAEESLVSARRDLTKQQFDSTFPELAEKKKVENIAPPTQTSQRAPARPPAPPPPPPPPPTPADKRVVQARKRQQRRTLSTSRRATIATSKRGDLSPANTEKKSLLGS